MAHWSASDLQQLADKYLAECFSRERRPRVSELAATVSLSAGHFSNLFLHMTGERPAAYFRKTQVRRAKRLLRETNLAMNSIAYGDGFATRANFFRVFKRLVRMTPGEYRKISRSRRRDHHQH
jgi:AraC-like DNA-binding protein